jgi:ADP-dependent NAD(P)H-hydrate dehydratase
MPSPRSKDRAKASGILELKDALLRRWALPIPGSDGDKEERGRVLVVGGSHQMPGAVILAAIAALRAGAGKLTIATAARVAPMVAQAVCESRVISLAETGSGSFTRASARSLPDDSSAVLIGPGMEGDARNCAFVGAVLERLRGAKVVLDAGAMDVIGALPRRIIEARSGVVSRAPSSSSPILLTPHAGELAHLSGSDKSRILDNPEAAVLDAARRWNAVVALKGAITFIGAPDGSLWRHEGGNIGLATSGSGDVLSGLITGFAARGATIEQASAWGVAVHAHAGSALAARVGTLGYLARELAGEVPAIMQALMRKPRRS